MRPTSVIAGLLALLAAFWVLAWAINPTPATQAPPDSVPAPQEMDPDQHVPLPETPPRDKSDEFASNPFTLSSDGPQPKAVVDEPDFKFGRLAVMATGQHDFTIRNEGTVPLKLAKGHTTCKCTGFTLGIQEIAPGDSATIHLEWKPVAEEEAFSQRATIWSNDPAYAEIELRVEGEVVPVIKVVPAGLWTAGSVSEGAPTTVKGYIASASEPFEIKSIEVPSQFIAVTHEPLDEATLAQEKMVSGYWISCTVDPSIPVGVFKEVIKVNLSVEKIPMMPITIQGARIGPFQVIGPGWRQANQTLYMGRCKSAEGKKVQISMLVANKPGRTIEFGEPQVTPPVLKVSMKRNESFDSSGGREQHLIVFEAVPGSTPGRWMGDTAVKVHLPCNHPDANGANFSVEFQVD